MADINTLKQGLIVTAFWEAKPDEVDALKGIIRKFLPQAQAEAGVLAFQIHQSREEPTKFFFYEVFKDEAVRRAQPGAALQDADSGAGGAPARQARTNTAPLRLTVRRPRPRTGRAPSRLRRTGCGRSG